MSEYKDAVRVGVSEGVWTIGKILPIVLLVVLLLSAFGFVLNSAGLLGSTIVERKVFEHSYQYSETVKAEIATYEAQLVELNYKLSSDLDANTKANLEAQASGIRIQLAVARSRE